MNTSNKIALLILALLLAVIPGTHAQQQTTDQTFFLTFVPNVQFSPVYVALEKGYFADAGVNFSLEYGDEPDGVARIGADQLKFGIISGEQIILARATGIPVVFTYEWFQRYPVGIVVADDSGIETVEDLAGLKIGIPGRFGASYSGLTALLSSAGMTEADIQLEPIGYNAPEVFCVESSGLDGAVVYINNEPLQIQRRAEAGECGDVTGVRVISVASAADMVSNGVTTNEATIADNPELVQGIVSAFDAGLRDAINNPAEAYLLSAVYVEGLLTDEQTTIFEAEAVQQTEFLATNPDRAAIAESRVAMRARLLEQLESDELVQFDVLLDTIELWDAEQLGVTDAASWDVTQEVLLTTGFLENSIDLTGAYTNAFVED